MANAYFCFRWWEAGLGEVSKHHGAQSLGELPWLAASARHELSCFTCERMKLVLQRPLEETPGSLGLFPPELCPVCILPLLNLICILLLP